MQSRILAGMDVSPLGLGCWAIGGTFSEADGQPLSMGQANDLDSIRAIHAGLDAGINLLDTADIYGAGHSERLIAQAIKGRRDRVVIATKFGFTFDEASRVVEGEDASPEYIHSACEGSLQRLGTDYIDLLQFHLNVYDVEKGAEVRDTLEELVAQGKIRAYGWSTDFVDRAAVFSEGPNCAAIQFEHNVLHQNNAMVDFCRQSSLASINRGPLAMGLLSGKYTNADQFNDDDIRRKTPDWLVYFNDGVPEQRFVQRLEALRDILTSGGRSLVQGALAWLWATSPNNIPIPGFRDVNQVEHNAQAMTFGPLGASEVEESLNLFSESV